MQLLMIELWKIKLLLSLSNGGVGKKKKCHNSLHWHYGDSKMCGNGEGGEGAGGFGPVGWSIQFREH
jgi:hypothetical protein